MNNQKFTRALRDLIRAEIHYSKFYTPENAVVVDDCYEALASAIKNKQTRFVPPIVQEVAGYCSGRNNKVCAQTFVDFYESKNWFVGKNKMKDWKASVRTWEKRDEKQISTRTSKSGFSEGDSVGAEWLRDERDLQ